MIIVSFMLFLVMFVVIGVASFIYSRHTSADYLIASQDIKPWLAALSAVATNNSGYMFIGMIGFTYMVGMASLWLMIGWVSGDFLSSFYIHKKLRLRSEQKKALSYAGLLSCWSGTEFPVVRTLGGLITTVFLGIYAAAQLKAGSKALHVLLGWDYAVGAIIGAVIVLLYCFAGGIRASIWTDAAQSLVMVGAMGTLCLMSVIHIGGFAVFIDKLHLVSPSYMSLFPPELSFGPLLGPLLFVLGWFFAGLGVVGQPHIMIRFMAVDSAANMTRTRMYYYTWYILFYCLTFLVGLMARLIMPEVASFDAELALPMLAKHLLSDFFIGLVLAGIFAATMSTADSQIISCTAAIGNDLRLNAKGHYWLTKTITGVVTLVALFFALFAHENVFQLVLVAWSALASAFVPLLTVYTLGGRPTERTAVAMMLVGFFVMFIWRLSGLSEEVYEIMPGMLSGFLPFILQMLHTRFSAPVTKSS